MNTAVKIRPSMVDETSLSQHKAGEIMEAVIARGDLGQLTPEERAKYYTRVCESIGLNPMTKPFEYITLNNKLTLYARKDATDQLRKLYSVSVTDLAESERDGVFIVTAKVADGNGRTDAAKGAVNIANLKGEALANALMKAETKAKRRATLSICGLGFLDETEIEDIPQKLTHPPAPPVYSRAEKAKQDWEDKKNSFVTAINSKMTVEDLHTWGSDMSVEVAGFPPEHKTAIYAAFKARMGKVEAEAVADQVVITEAGERSATPADFETADT